MKTLAVLTLALLSLAGASHAWAFEAELDVYRRSLHQVCEIRVTPEMTRLYEAAVNAADTAGYGAGRGSNFWAPKSPEHAYFDCFQAGGEQR